MAEPRFEVGDLVFYKPTFANTYADGTKEIGVVIEVRRDTTPLFVNFPEQEFFEYEYRIRWIASGYVSTLLPFNIEKVKMPKKNLDKSS